MFPFGNDNAKKFNENLESLEKIVYKTGAFRGGNEIRTYTFEKDKVKKVVEKFYGKDSPAPVTSCPYTKEEFLQGLKGFEIGKWKDKYNDPRALDGWYWDLKFEYAGDIKRESYYGSNAYPKNYKDFEKFMKAGEEK